MTVTNDEFVVVPAEKASHNIVFVCKSHYIDCMINVYGIINSLKLIKNIKEWSNTGQTSALVVFLWNFNQFKMKNLLPFHSFWNLNCNRRYLLGLPNACVKSLFKWLTSILSAVKVGLQSYCDTKYSREGVTQMWILKNSLKILLEYIRSMTLLFVMWRDNELQNVSYFMVNNYFYPICYLMPFDRHLDFSTENRGKYHITAIYHVLYGDVDVLVWLLLWNVKLLEPLVFLQLTSIPRNSRKVGIFISWY